MCVFKQRSEKGKIPYHQLFCSQMGTQVYRARTSLPEEMVNRVVPHIEAEGTAGAFLGQFRHQKADNFVCLYVVRCEFCSHEVCRDRPELESSEGVFNRVGAAASF